jgi:uncharacterized membrane protein
MGEHPPMTKRTLIIILAVGAAMRLLLIWQSNLWFDENYSLILARLPVNQLIAATAGDVHPPLYYLIIWPLAHISWLPAWAIRLPSLLFSLGALALLPRLMDHLRVDPRVQIITLVMMAVLPFQIHYAQEGRMYALLEFLFLLGALAVFEGRASWLALIVAAMLYTQNYGALYAATLWLLIIGREGYSPLSIRMQQGIVLGFIGWLPWALVLKSQMAFISGSYWLLTITPGSVLYNVWKLFYSSSLNHPAGLGTSMPITFALILLGIWHLISRRPFAWASTAMLAFGPLLMSIIASVMFQPILLFRALIGISPFIYLICAYPLGEIRTRRAALAAAVFILPILVMSIGGYYLYNADQKEQVGNGRATEAMQYLREHWQPGDVLYHSGDISYVNMSPFISVPQYVQPACSGNPFAPLSDQTRRAIGEQLQPLDQVHAGRVWYVFIWTPLLPECALDEFHSITADAAPAFTMQDDDHVYSGIWLLK